MDRESVIVPKSSSVALPDAQVLPAPSAERRTRRLHSVEYKLAILAEADQCQHGEVAALLRRERLHSSHLSDWRRLRDTEGLALSKSTPGPTPKLTPEQRRIQQLERDNARLQRRAEIAEGCVELQKKLNHLLEQAQSENDS